MKIAGLLVLTSALVIFAAEPKGGLGSVPDAPAPVSAAAARVAKPAVRSICPAGTAQDASCLIAGGAVGADGKVSAKTAKALLTSGVCPCQSTGGVSTGTVPFDNGDL